MLLFCISIDFNQDVENVNLSGVIEIRSFFIESHLCHFHGKQADRMN